LAAGLLSPCVDFLVLMQVDDAPLGNGRDGAGILRESVDSPRQL